MNMSDANLVKKSTEYMFNYLVHPYPRIRKCAAEELYLAMITHSEPTQNQSEIETLLLNTVWEGKMEEVQSKREELKQLMPI